MKWTQGDVYSCIVLMYYGLQYLIYQCNDFKQGFNKGKLIIAPKLWSVS
jgi:hypothetical protein